MDSLLPTCRGFTTGTGTDNIKDQRDSIYLIYGYKDGQLHGLDTRYNTDGTINYLVCYQNGVRQAYSLLDSLLPTCRGFTTGTGTDTIRDLRDSIYLIYGYQNGQLHGLYTYYYTGGRILFLDCYQNGAQTDSLLPTCRGFSTGTGTDTIRDLRDSIDLIYGYKDGQLHGLYTRYYTSGTIEHTANYQNGQPHGLQTFYNTDGTIRSLSCYQNGRRRKRTSSNFNSFTCP